MAIVDTHRSVALRVRGVLLPEGIERDLFVIDGRITFRAPEEVTTVLEGGFVIPGLVDAHAHLGLASPAPASASPEERARASAGAHLDSGVLLVREPGGPNRASTGIGPHEGLPRVQSGGRFLAPPGRYFPGLSRVVPEEALPAAAEEEARASGAWAKVIADWPDADGRMRPNYRPEALAEAARRVHAVGGRIAAHATCAESIEGAIEAGFDSIEHAEGLQDDHIAAMARRGIALVPTLTILPFLPQAVVDMGLRRGGLQEMLGAIKRHPQMVGRAAAAGVLILAGTDAGMGPHGMVRQEILNLAEAGLGAEAALAAGSWAARRFLGLPGLEEGALADLVAYPDDPRRDLGVLARPSVRILDGRLLPPPF